MTPHSTAPTTQWTSVVLKRNRKRRLEAGHPWIFSSEIDEIQGPFESGQLVHILNHQNLYMATAYANPSSQIVCRILSYNEFDDIDLEFFKTRVRQAKALRERLLGSAEGYRLIYGEADFLPGLVVDRYKDILVAQILTAGMERFKEWILEALVEECRPTGVYWRNDVSVRKLEGLSLYTEVAYGTVPNPIRIVENGLKFDIDVYSGQKTGHFFDQRDNRRLIRPFVAPTHSGRGAKMLECFCHTGAFTAHALAYGANHVTAVDISQTALDAAHRNLELNGLEDRATFVCANAFDYLRELESDGERYDVILLDPPAFAKSKNAVEGALRGYKDINLRALRLLHEGGFLITASCSSHVTAEMFQDTVLDAAVDAHRLVRLIEFRGAGPDHPELAAAPENNYLKFAVYEVRSRGPKKGRGR